MDHKNKSYEDEILGTEKLVFQEISQLNIISKSIRQRLKDQVLEKIEEHLEGVFQQLNW